jgi:hypothetical protein
MAAPFPEISMRKALLFVLPLCLLCIAENPTEAKPIIRAPKAKELADVFFVDRHQRRRLKITPGDIPENAGVAGEHAGNFAARMRILALQPIDIWTLIVADTNGDKDLTDTELEAYFALELAGKAPAPTPAHVAYVARRTGMTKFLSLLESNDSDKDGRLSFAELSLGDSDRERFDSADLNGDDCLDVHEFPGWEAAPMLAQPGPDDPFRCYRHIGSGWTHAVSSVDPKTGKKKLGSGVRTEVIASSAVGAWIASVSVDDRGRVRRDATPQYYRVPFGLGSDSLIFPNPAHRTEKKESFLVGSTTYECVIYAPRHERADYYSPQLPGIAVKYDGDMMLEKLDLVQPKGAANKPAVTVEDDRAAVAAINVFLLCDRNQDGRVTAAEYLAATARYRDEQCKSLGADVRAHVEAWISPYHFVYADTDGEDGLSHAEFEAYRRILERRGSYRTPGSVSRAQVERLVMILAADTLDRFDTNRDGVLTDDDEISGERHSSRRKHSRADLDKDGKITKGELEEFHRARFLARSPQIAAAKEGDTGVHAWKLEDKNLNFELFKKRGRTWTIEVTIGAGGDGASGRFENRILQVDEDGAVVLQRRFNSKGQLLVASKIPVSFNPDFEALLLPPAGAELAGQQSLRAAGKNWKCDHYKVSLPDGTVGEEWISTEFPGLRIKSVEKKGAVELTFELSAFRD